MTTGLPARNYGKKISQNNTDKRKVENELLEMLRKYQPRKTNKRGINK